MLFGVALELGALLGGFSELPLEDELPCREPVVPLVLTLRPGKALAATSANTPVSATEPAINQRLARLRRCNALSRAFARIGVMRSPG